MHTTKSSVCTRIYIYKKTYHDKLDRYWDLEFMLEPLVDVDLDRVEDGHADQGDDQRGDVRLVDVGEDVHERLRKRQLVKPLY